MNNSPELSSKAQYLGTITSDFIHVCDALKDASYHIRRQKVSEHPIFIIAKTDISLGALLVGKQDKPELKWNYNASYLQEFVQKKVIDADKEEAFKNTYKNPDEYCCLFVIDDEFTSFIFIPYPEEENN
jgi:carboxypeptidase C (cathepsin A)